MQGVHLDKEKELHEGAKKYSLARSQSQMLDAVKCYFRDSLNGGYSTWDHYRP